VTFAGVRAAREALERKRGKIELRIRARNRVGRDAAKDARRTGCESASVLAARKGGDREVVVVELAREIDAMQRRDRARVEMYVAAAGRYLREFDAAGVADMELGAAHEAARVLAERWLPRRPPGLEDDRADAQ
jgi:hypothetical protein